MEEREEWWRGRGCKRAWTRQGLRSASELRWKVVLGAELTKNQKHFSLEGNSSEGGGEEKLLLAARVKRREEGREQRGAEPFTLFSDQRTEYRLETEEREKHRE